ncbi:hypothetical protein GQ44DRAFT_718427 [Phaeosphaeriaceae sp. PMI808]|nr:hypothetical protein GQ44DRAFT_718427 [Phaeosphaeriaceae sp. PMI808]
MSTPTRIIIKACVTDIPGDVCRRPITLGEIFCHKVLNRQLNTRIQESGFDAIHIPGGFDSKRPLRRWFIYDLNVVEELGKDELNTISHSVYQAHLVKNEWLFEERKVWRDSAIKYCNMFTWGGKTEQEMARKLRENNKTEIDQ